MAYMKPMIYLDVDGVILANESNVAKFADVFLQHIIKNYSVTWLTTHCMNNDPKTVIERLQGLLEPVTMELLSQVRGAKWDLWKTEAIDFSRPFLWFDDDCYPEEKAALEQHEVLANWVEINLSKDEQQLQRYLNRMPTAKTPIVPRL